MMPLLLILTLLLRLLGPSQPVYYKTEEGKVSFKSTAPLELIEAHSTSLRGIIDPQKNSYAFQVKLNSFNGFNSALQAEHFHENYMESDRHPEASFKGKIIELIDFQKAGTHQVRAKGQLLIHGVEQERIITASMNIEKERIHIVSDFSVLLADHQIKVPQILHDKLASDIKVHVDAIFTKE